MATRTRSDRSLGSTAPRPRAPKSSTPRRSACSYCRARWVKSVCLEGERVELCLGHARALALGTPATRAALDAAVAALPERRRGADRRAGDDRRTFPRPEGRRMSDGRRATDG